MVAREPARDQTRRRSRATPRGPRVSPRQATARETTSALSSDITVKVYDMTGRMLGNTTVKSTDVSSLQIGENYPSGVYNVIVTQGDNAKTLRVIKR